MNLLGVLLAHRIRRDRVQLLLWVLGTAALAFMAIAAVVDTFGDRAERESILRLTILAPAILVFRGTPNGAGEGEFATFLILAFLALLAGLMSTFLAVRHTRGDEEQGRAELVEATPAGRTLPTVATVAHGVLANAVLGLAVRRFVVGAASARVLGLCGFGQRTAVHLAMGRERQCVQPHDGRGNHVLRQGLRQAGFEALTLIGAAAGQRMAAPI